MGCAEMCSSDRGAPGSSTQPSDQREEVAARRRMTTSLEYSEATGALKLYRQC